MNPSQLAESLARRKTWDEAESHLIDLLTDTNSGLNNYERRHDGFVVNLDGLLKPILVPYRPGAAPVAAPPPPEPLQKAQEPAGEALSNFEASEPQEPAASQPEPSKRASKVITVPRPTPKSSPDEMMMSLAGLTMRYDKHARECIAFVLSKHARIPEEHLDQAVDETLGDWMSYLKTRLPR